MISFAGRRNRNAIKSELTKIILEHSIENVIHDYCKSEIFHSKDLLRRHQNLVALFTINHVPIYNIQLWM